jgi:predicted amidohydrolase YtcJ
VCNTRALRIAGITRHTPDPEGARFERDPTGEPNGILTEIAAVDSVLATRKPLSREDQVRAVARLSDHFADHGIVAVADLLATAVPEPLQTFRLAAEHGFRPQAALYYAWTDLAGRDPVPDLTDQDRTGRVKIAGIKLFMDGAMSNRTAWTEDPYPDSDLHGMCTISDAELLRAVAWARRNQVQVAIHSMGDRATQHVIDLLGDHEPWMGDLPSVRIDHATIVTAEQVQQIRTARMSFAVVSHTIFFFAEYDNYVNNLSPTQFARTYPIRSYYDHLPWTALSSDRPATTWADADNVFVSIKAAVLREAYNGAPIVAEQAITVPQAVLLYTGRASRVAPLDGVGMIAPGYEGSFVVLDRDIFTIPAEQIDQVRVDQTYVAGERVFARA